VARFKEQQAETLQLFRECCVPGRWSRLHRGHFDWWMFPIDDGSKPQWNITSEDDVEELKEDPEWLANYREAVQLAALAWGWDVQRNCRVEAPADGQAWTNWDVRLAKMCRSLYLFEEKDLLDSLQAFARDLQAKEKKGKGFFYGMICLDELLYFELPRRDTEAGAGRAPRPQPLDTQPLGERPAPEEPVVEKPVAKTEGAPTGPSVCCSSS